MANKGPSTNGSQFYIAFRPAAHLDKKHTVFGKLVGGEDVLDALESLPVKPGTERPAKQVKITEVVMYVPYVHPERFSNMLTLFLSLKLSGSVRGVQATRAAEARTQSGDTRDAHEGGGREGERRRQLVRGEGRPTERECGCRRWRWEVSQPECQCKTASGGAYKNNAYQRTARRGQEKASHRVWRL